MGARGGEQVRDVRHVKEERYGRKGRRRGGRNVAPRPFIKVGAYDCNFGRVP